MENATDAFKMAAAVLIMVMALSVAIFAFTRVRQASTEIMKYNNKSYYDAENLNIISNRKVGIETIIPTLYSYYKNNVTILFYIGNGYDSATGKFTSITPLTLYYTEALENVNNVSESNLQKSTLAIKDGNLNSRAIFGLDINDELTRQEPWTYNEDTRRKFIESLINDYKYINNDTNQAPIYNISRGITSRQNNKINQNSYSINFKYSSNIEGKLITNTGAKFIERLGQYNYSTTNSNSGTIEANTSKDTSTINFTNGETIKNENGNQKKIIQYIYIKTE